MSSPRTTRHFGIVTQVYPPDPAAVGQHLADVAEELGRRGHCVSVFTSDRAYDDPSHRFTRFERSGNVKVLRLPLSSFGKGSIGSRLASGASLLAQAGCLTAFDFRLTDLLLSTTPHVCGALGVLLQSLRGLPFHYWLMDLNPDQIVAYGKLPADSPAVRGFDWLNRQILTRAASITTLDATMAARFAAKSSLVRQIDSQPPWAAQSSVASVGQVENQFRNQYGLGDARVIMHAGNHSAVHPLDTLLEAIRLSPHTKLHYCFVGGGVGKSGVEAWARREPTARLTLLSYQPRATVDTMLSAADVHVVSVGNNTVGIVHPSKIYGALAAARPVIVLGPANSPAAQVVRDFAVGWHVEHGDIDGACSVLAEIDQIPDSELLLYKQRAQRLAVSRFSRELGVRAFCDRLLSLPETRPERRAAG